MRIQYEVLRGDSLIGDRPFREVYPADAPGYAGGREWYHTNEPIRLNGQAYAKYGFPRVLAPHEVEMVGGFDGVTLFAEVGAARPLDALYVAVRHGCVFQIYLNNQHASAVRG